MMTMGPTSLKPRQKKRKYGPVQVMMAAIKETGSRDRFQKNSTKMDRSRPKEGTRQVSQFFRGSSDCKRLAVDTKYTPIAYVSSLFLQP